MKKQLVLNDILCPYDIYDDDRVYSYKKEKFMKIQIDKESKTNRLLYRKVKIFIPGIGPKRMAVHRLVALMFIPNPNNLPQVNHKDGDKGNNNVSNLEWVTAQENTQHAHDNNLCRFNGGICCPVSKWNLATIVRICELLSSPNNYTVKEIATMTGTNRQLVTSILTRTTWTSISEHFPNMRKPNEPRWVKFHMFVDSLIRYGNTKEYIYQVLKNEGLTMKEIYNLVNSRLRKDPKLKKIYNEVNKNHSIKVQRLSLKKD